MRYRILLFFVLLILIDSAIGLLFKPYYDLVRLPQYWGFYERYVHAEEPYDIILMGDSRVQHGIHATYISDACTCRARNLALSAATMVSNYYLLRDYLAENNPQLVVLGMHWSRLAPQPDPYHYPLLLEILPQRDSLEYALTSLESNFAAQSILRSYRYRNALPRFVRGNLEPEPDLTADNIDQFVPVNADFAAVNLQGDIERYLRPFDSPPDRTQRIYLEKTLAMLREKNIPVLVVQLPELAAVTNEIRNASTLEDSVMDVVEKYGVAYERFDNASPLATDSAYYSDVMHLNARGADLYSGRLWNTIEKYFEVRP